MEIRKFVHLAMQRQLLLSFTTFSAAISFVLGFQSITLLVKNNNGLVFTDSKNASWNRSEVELSREEIIHQTNDTLNLPQDCWSETNFDRDIIKIKRFETYCDGSDASNTCMLLSRTDLFNYKSEPIHKLKHSLAIMNNTSFLVSYCSRIRESLGITLGEEDSNVSQNITFKSFYFMKNVSNDKLAHDMLFWKREFIEKVLSFSKNTCFDVCQSDQNSVEDPVPKDTRSGKTELPVLISAKMRTFDFRYFTDIFSSHGLLILTFAIVICVARLWVFHKNSAIVFFGIICGVLMLEEPRVVFAMLVTALALWFLPHVLSKLFIGTKRRLLKVISSKSPFVVASTFEFETGTKTGVCKKGKARDVKFSNEHNQPQTVHFKTIKKHNPVAVVGISCRFAKGVNSKDAFWNMLVNGKCVIGSYPTNRLEEKEMRRFYNPGRSIPGKHYTLKGAFLDKVSGFDANFFGMSPTECRALDPQQRLLLQVVYEAIEDAGLRLEDLQKFRTGVYVGLMNLDYGRLLLDNDNVPNIDEFASTGITASTVANRISFLLNLTGPSLTIDTACSSSLTALNIAFTHLQLSECEVAIVCAPNLILARYFHTACCRTCLLAEDGRCKSFDVKGDGYGRGEGIAAVVLKPTSLARLDRDDVYAEILACGLNNDGQNAIPMTSPSEKMQLQLARRVLAESGLKKEDVQYVETHGTGTAVGDVVEMRSVSDVYGNSSSRVLRIGSVKSNINHTESTAGLAGLIKVCLMIKHGYFVPTINIHEIKPQLMIPERKMAVQVEYEKWTTSNKRRIGAVCCYGYGGANAHVIVREMKPLPVLETGPKDCRPRIMTLSARSRDALKMMAKRFAKWIETKPDNDSRLKENICYTLNNRRSVHSHRLAVTFRSLKNAASLLEMFADNTPGWKKFVAVGDTATSVKKLAFIYGGQGGCLFGTAKEMMENEPKFKETIKRIDQVLKTVGVPWSLTQELLKSADKSRLRENVVGQIALFAVHHTMTELLKSWGIFPTAVVGHSLGEISAACTANAITLDKALELVLLRSRLQESCSPTGRMVAVGMRAEDARKLLEKLKLESQVSVSVVNGPSDVVLSGEEHAMVLVQAYLQQHHTDVFLKTLKTTRAFHSMGMEGIKNLFMKGVNRIKLTPGPTKIPFYSTVTGKQIPGHLLTDDHWWRNIRQPVIFTSAIESLMNDGYKNFVEINATPQLFRYVHEIAYSFQKRESSHSRQVTVISTLPNMSAEEQHMSFLQNCPATLFTFGYPVSWDRIQGSGSKSFIRCPTYPWQEKDYWYREAEPQEYVRPLTATKEDPEVRKSHPLLGKNVPTEAFSGLHAWESEIDLYTLPFLKDHAFLDSDDAVIPGAFYLETGLALVLHMFPDVIPRLHDVTFNNLLTIAVNDVLHLRTRLDMTDGPEKEGSYQITAIEGNGNEIIVSKGFTVFDRNRKSAQVGNVKSNMEKLKTLKSRLNQQPLEIFNRERLKRRFRYGPQFSLITESWCSNTEALCTISLTKEIQRALSSYVVHPSIIDACFQSLFILKQPIDKPVPYRVKDITVVQKNFTKLMFCHVKVIGNDKYHACDVILMDCQGNVLLLINGFLMVDLSDMRPDSLLNDMTFEIQWKLEQKEPRLMEAKLSWLIIPDKLSFAQRFISQLPKNQSTLLVELNSSPSLDAVFSNALAKAKARLEADEGQKLCVVNFLPVENNALISKWENFQQGHLLAFESSLVLLQAILRHEHFAKQVHLVLVTSESVPSLSESNKTESVSKNFTYSAFPWSSTLFGFRRTVAEELTAPKASIVDLPRNPSPDDFQVLVKDLQATEVPEEIAYRDGLRYLNQINRIEAVQAKPTRLLSSFTSGGNPRPFKLSFVSGEVCLSEATTVKSQEHSSEIEVTHVCPLEKINWTSPCDMVVVCGKLTKNFSHPSSEGNLVIAVCDASQVGNFMVIDNSSICKVNPKLAPEKATALCFPQAASFYILNEIIKDCRGKKILICTDRDVNACVFAAVASSFGATVIYLSRNTQNKDYVKEFGVSIVVSPEDVSKKEETNKLGFQIACLLSKPSSDTLQRIVECVQEDGKVITISHDTNDGFNVFVTKNVFFVNTSVDNIVGDSKKFKNLMSSCTTLLDNKGYLQKLQTLPHRSTPISDVIPKGETPILEIDEDSESVFGAVTFEPHCMPEVMRFSKFGPDLSDLRSDRTYLVVGGVRGFGFEVVCWMVENGAKTVVCTARSPPSEEKKAKVLSLERATGSTILLRQADVTSWQDMASINDELNSLPDVAGIVFSAMVLKDQRIKDADLETCKEVVETKVKGSVILHQLSLSMNLDFFILFSSIAGVIGNVGQLAYSAANTFLDALCEYRGYKLGLPALSVDWGTMGGAGILERSKEIANLFKNYGFRLMSCKKGMDFLKEFLLHHPDHAQVVLCDIDWSTYLKSSGFVLHKSHRLQLIKDEISHLTKNGNLSTGLTLKELSGRPPEQRKKTVEEFVRNLLSTWTEGSSNEVDLNLALYKYGLDSIGAANMSLQIRNGIGAVFEIYYFIQPKTTGLTMINDTLNQIENWDKRPRNMASSTDRQDTAAVPDIDKVTLLEERKNVSVTTLESQECYEKVVPLYVPDDALVKVFMMHSSHKSALANSPFAAGFHNQETVALYSVGIDDLACNTREYGNVRELAKRYLGLIKDEQPIGPYYLAGFSFGGILCFEVASQLMEQDEDVAMVFMIDTFAWFPEPSFLTRKYFTDFKESLIKNIQEQASKRFLKTLALGSLGYCLTEFDKLLDKVGTEEQMLSVLERKATERNLSLHKFRDQVTALQHEIAAASYAHFEWKPSKRHLHKTLTYIQCQISKQTQNVSLLWSATDAWRSLTGEMDLFSMPGNHFDLIDQPYATVCGSLIMTTASIRHRSWYTFGWQFSPGSCFEERLIEWIKNGVDINISFDEGAVLGKLWLNKEETRLTFLCSNCEIDKPISINLLDIHNIVPGKYVDTLCSKDLNGHGDIDLIISLITAGNRKHQFLCLDWKQRNQLMDVFEVLLDTPLLKF